ncbi:MAG: hypothetical protein LE168_01915 [Endomicrobium sp.]|nr:hypothetical protein [Endomicrobium sp.]
MALKSVVMNGAGSMFFGVYTALITPFKNNKIDFDALERLIVGLRLPMREMEDSNKVKLEKALKDFGLLKI